MKQFINAVIVALGMIALVACSNGIESKVKELESLAEKLETTAVANRVNVADRIDAVTNEINERYDELTEDQVRRADAAYERAFTFLEKVATDQVNALGNMLEGTSNIVNQFNDMVEEDEENEDVDEEYDEDEDAATSELDEEIDKYEELVNKFISNQKNGMDILSNTPTYEKAQELEIALTDETGKMSSTQSNRFTALMKKLQNAYLFGTHDESER